MTNKVVSKFEVVTDAQKTLALANQTNEKDHPKISNNWNGHKIALVVILGVSSVLAATAAVVSGIFASYLIAALCAAAFVALTISTILASRITLSKDLLSLIDDLSKKVSELYNKQKTPPQDISISTTHASENKHIYDDMFEISDQYQQIEEKEMQFLKNAQECIQESPIPETPPEEMEEFKKQVEDLKQQLNLAKNSANDVQSENPEQFLEISEKHKIHSLKIKAQKFKKLVSVFEQQKDQVKTFKEKRNSLLTQKDPLAKSSSGQLELKEDELNHLENTLQEREEQLEQLQEKFQNIKQTNQELLVKIQELENSVKQIRETKHFLNNQNYELIQTINSLLVQLEINPIPESQFFSSIRSEE